MGPFEKATAFASGPWTQIHGHCHQRNAKAQNKHLTQAHGDSLRSWKDSYQSGNSPVLGLKGFLKLFVLWIVKSRDWSERNLLKLSKKKRLRQNGPRPICALSEENGKKLSPNVYVCYLYQPGELEGRRQRATDHNWSLKVYNVLPPFVKPNEPIVYYVQDSLKRGRYNFTPI